MSKKNKVMELERRLWEIHQKIEDLNKFKDRLEEEIAKEFFSEYTVEKIRLDWNNGGFDERLTMMEKCPRFERAIRNVAYSAGLEYDELRKKILENEWIQNRSMDMDEIFSPYCSPKK